VSPSPSAGRGRAVDDGSAAAAVISDREAPESLSSDNQLTPRGRRTKNILVQAAKEIFERDGFKEARIADIATQAGTSYGSFYTYFDSKEAIFREVVHGVTGEMFVASKSGDASHDDPVERIDQANRAFLMAYARNARIVSIIEEMSIYDDYFKNLRLQIRNLFLQRNEHGIRLLQEKGLADPHLDPVLASSALGGMVEHFAHFWFVLKQPFDEELAISTLTRLYSQAIGLAIEPPDEG
jgi:AcrR family transcriptional regulator